MIWIYPLLVVAMLTGAYSLPCLLSVMRNWCANDHEAPFCLRAVSSFVVSGITLGWLLTQYSSFEIREALEDLKVGNHMTGALFYGTLIALAVHAVTLVAMPVLMSLHLIGARKRQTA